MKQTNLNLFLWRADLERIDLLRADRRSNLISWPIMSKCQSIWRNDKTSTAKPKHLFGQFTITIWYLFKSKTFLPWHPICSNCRWVVHATPSRNLLPFLIFCPPGSLKGLSGGNLNLKIGFVSSFIFQLFDCPWMFAHSRPGLYTYLEVGEWR